MTDPEARHCPHCSKKLRTNNTKGVCADCSARGRTLENAPETPDVSLYDVKTTGERTAAPRVKSDTLKRFRIVAAALDEDADALLEAFAESWLAQLKERVSGS